MQQVNTVPVVITRPLKQAQTLAAMVHQIGRSPVVFPLLEILPSAHPDEVQHVLDQLAMYALVIFVSPSAVDAVLPQIQHWPKEVMIGVVGKGSRLALSQYNVTVDSVTIFAPDDPMKSDSEGLLDLLPIPHLREQRVLIVRGQNGRDVLADTLLKQGVYIDFLSAYQRVCPEFTVVRQQQLQAIMKEKNDWIFTSSEALHFLKTWIDQCAMPELVAKMQRQRIIVTHPRIQETAQALGFSHVVLSGAGNQQLIAILQS